ncbi:MAG: nitrate reductase [Pseudomonadota bacterium]
MSTCTTCPYCGVGCGVIAEPDGQGGVTIAGDPAHPANFGRLCSKGAALGETLDLEGRLLTPEVDGRRAGWDEATALIADRFSAAIAEHGPDSVAFYVSGQLLTEDYYVANKLMKGYIGSANIDTNSRLCMASSVAGHKRAFGTDMVPGTYEDLEQADLVVLVGSNLAWCHPVLYQRLAAAKSARPGMRVVCIDPRRTATAALADQVLPLSPGSDVALFNGLLTRIEAAGAVNTRYVAEHVSGLPAAMLAARSSTLAAVAVETGLAETELARFYNDWISTERVVTVYSQGVNQSTSGTDKVGAILNCHLATGRIGRAGMGPFSVTGQPNAMGGREVGGLATMLAAHMDLDNPEHRSAVRGFWQSPKIADRPGLKAVDLFRAAADGRVQALWIMSTNPAVSMPEADAVAAAIRACPFVVVSDILQDTYTARLADVLLPAAAWGEKSGTVTNSERRISRQRPFLPAPGEARPDWKALADVGAAMGWPEAFSWDSPAAVFREHAALSRLGGQLGCDFDISGMAAIPDVEYDRLAPVQWPVNETRSGGRFYADGAFHTGDGKARMQVLRSRLPAEAVSPAWPLRLNTGRVRDQWHTMTRTAKAPRLASHIAEPYAEIHPADAVRAGIGAASLVQIESPHGTAVVRALVTDRTPEGSIFAPMHWTAATASAGRIDALVSAHVDPISGQPELKAQPVRVTPYKAAWHGFAVSLGRLDLATDYWARARIRGGWRAELAGLTTPACWSTLAHQLFGLDAESAVTLDDPLLGIARLAITGRRGSAVLYVGRGPVEVARSHIVAAMEAGEPPATLLAGRPSSESRDPGAIVCGCYGVGINAILAAAAEGATSVEDLGVALNAGTGCGSCKPELAALLADALPRVAAE